MIKISQLKLPIHHTEDAIKQKVSKLLRVPMSDLAQMKITRQSIDARKKDQIFYIYAVEIELADKESDIVKRAKNPNIILGEKKQYLFPRSGNQPLSKPPVVIGSGPAGLICALMLSRAGYAPVLVERGEDVDSRKKKVESFWLTGTLDERSNVQFGEGGAGTFSDGKLNTLVKDPSMRNQKVLELLVEAGADPSILYHSKPHIGTDVLSQVVKNIRSQIIAGGGRVLFSSQVTDLITDQGCIKGLVINDNERVETDVAVLAIGHSARDTFSMLLKKQIHMEQKSFAVGLRIQHPQAMINKLQYGMEDPGELGAATYKLTAKTSINRGVYSFCMCPGGYVVNASSEMGKLAVNGMSNHDRGGINANSALIVTVTPEDFSDNHPLSGVEYQRNLEELSHKVGGGAIPIQLWRDFKQKKESRSLGDVALAVKGKSDFGNLHEIVPGYIHQALVEGMDVFERQLPGFGRHDAILAGVESRTSSPVKINRDDNFQCNVKGLYPCGEGAGYAGGITSAAMDGLRVAEAIASQYRPLK